MGASSYPRQGRDQPGEFGPGPEDGPAAGGLLPIARRDDVEVAAVRPAEAEARDEGRRNVDEAFQTTGRIEARQGTPLAEGHPDAARLVDGEAVGVPPRHAREQPAVLRLAVRA